MSSDPDQTRPASATPTVDLAQLDDKHLGRYRHPAEWQAILAIVVGAAALLVALWFTHPIISDTLSFMPGPLFKLIVEWTHPHRVWLVVLLALIATWTCDVVGQSAREWQLVARAAEITPSTIPDHSPIVDDLRARFDLPRTRVYISREAPVVGYTVGVREPYAIVMSATTVGILTHDEFRFLVGREMGHIKLRHTWAATLLGSANMHLPDPLAYLLKARGILFGSYQHAQELSCDRIGIIATRNVEPALSALIKQSFGAIKGSQIDIASLAPQAEALRGGLSGTSLKLMQRMSAQPFVVSRMLELIEWAGPPAERPAAQEPDVPAADPATPPPTPATVPNRQDAAAA
jgi:Zn-dependent protease with chaperone function